MRTIIEEISYVLEKFGIPFDSFDIKVFKSGHINSTYRVNAVSGGECHSYIAQKINTYVFSDPVGIMHNIALVTEHIRKKLISEGVDPHGKVLEFLNQKDGTNYLFEEGSFWRIYHYIPNSTTYDKVEDLKVLRNAGFSFGNFQKQLADFPMEELIDTMPGFHDTVSRMKNFFDACEKDVCGRAKEIEKEIEIIRSKEEIWSKLCRQRESGEIPSRVTHNDTKYNNILIDKTTGEAVCLIDLDTVIPGLCAYDFGDAIRFCANTAAEDEPDTSKVSLDMTLYEAFADGFIFSCKDFCSKAELESLALGAVTMAFELSARFLEDYLKGDKYFRTSHPKHNLERGRSQLALALDMEKKLDQMQKINQKYAQMA